jgi:hypothetical protein
MKERPDFEKMPKQIKNAGFVLVCPGMSGRYV